MNNRLPLLWLAILLVATPAAAQEAHDCVVIVLDASGSMNDMMPRSGGKTKMDAAKSAIETVVKDVDQETYVGLLVFSGTYKNADWVHELGPRNDRTMFEQLALIQAGGGTPLGSYIKTGADSLLAKRDEQLGYGSYRLLVVTDGEADAGFERVHVEEYTPEVLARGITLDTIGVNMNSRHTLATRSNSYATADNPKELTKALREVFAEVSQQPGDDTTDDAFAALAPVPDEMAMAMLEALCSSGNHPIGEEPPDPNALPDDATTIHDPPPSGSSSAAACSANPSGTDRTVTVAVALVLIAVLLGRTRRNG
jgi:von Willebrand factor type A domain